MQFNAHQFKNVAKPIAKQIVQLKENVIKKTLTNISKDITLHAPEYLQTHYATNLLILENEIDRLSALKAVNPQVRDEEIEFFQSQLNSFKLALNHSINRIDAIRLIITT
ncbi:hypothetical protein MNBD_GAMMA07-1050 [hydrothermal vent metagenome]|uniref:RNA polymerase recycling bacterial C-terminal domain-containing protein n=1 Tax=hydrothermal vent metagenome TaxID=652676 RepID=A0A3B0WJN8_9ZZZZ